MIPPTQQEQRAPREKGEAGRQMTKTTETEIWLDSPRKSELVAAADLRVLSSACPQGVIASDSFPSVPSEHSARSVQIPRTKHASPELGPIAGLLEKNVPTADHLNAEGPPLLDGRFSPGPIPRPSPVLYPSRSV